MKKHILSITLAAALLFSLLTGMGARPTDFTDLSPNHPHHEAITAMIGLRVMNGFTSDTFGPDAPATYGMLYTALHRLGGAPAATNPWYQGGMDWAQEHELSAGGEAPMAEVTLEELIINLWKYMDRPHRTAPLDEWYADARLLSEEGRSAMCWAINDGIIFNDTDTLNPHGIIDRGEMADAIWRMWRHKNLLAAAGGGGGGGGGGVCTCCHYCGDSINCTQSAGNTPNVAYPHDEVCSVCTSAVAP